MILVSVVLFLYVVFLMLGKIADKILYPVLVLE